MGHRRGPCLRPHRYLKRLPGCGRRALGRRRRHRPGGLDRLRPLEPVEAGEHGIGPSLAAIVPSPMMRGMADGKITRIGEWSEGGRGVRGPRVLALGCYRRQIAARGIRPAGLRDTHGTRSGSDRRRECGMVDGLVVAVVIVITLAVFVCGVIASRPANGDDGVPQNGDAVTFPEMAIPSVAHNDLSRYASLRGSGRFRRDGLRAPAVAAPGRPR